MRRRPDHLSIAKLVRKYIQRGAQAGSMSDVITQSGVSAYVGQRENDGPFIDFGLQE